jgi:hypothetical protein
MSPLTTKNTKFEVRIQNPMRHSKKTKSQQKAQKDHIEEGKSQGQQKDIKSGKPSQKGKEELRKAQNQNKTSKKSSNSKNSP